MQAAHAEVSTGQLLSILNKILFGVKKFRPNLLPVAVLVEPVKVVGDGGEAGGGADLAAKDGSEAGDAGEGSVGIADHEGSAGVAVVGAHAAGGVDADDPVPVEGAVVLVGHGVVEDGHGHLVDDVGHAAVELVAGLAPAGHPM